MYSSENQTMSGLNGQIVGYVLKLVGEVANCEFGNVEILTTALYLRTGFARAYQPKTSCVITSLAQEKAHVFAMISRMLFAAKAIFVVEVKNANYTAGFKLRLNRYNYINPKYSNQKVIFQLKNDPYRMFDPYNRKSYDERL